jgi:hypothetical protein
MTNIVETLLSRNLVDVFGEPDALKRRVANCRDLDNQRRFR